MRARLLEEFAPTTKSLLWKRPSREENPCDVIVPLGLGGELIQDGRDNE